mmetsp:Transcript_20417/g.30264  ORF Transcript_20417/g.30264 Transcript_20417/m.30264 type:complete len:89 (+) Transcript_20417:1105-1371(+)
MRRRKTLRAFIGKEETTRAAAASCERHKLRPQRQTALASGPAATVRDAALEEQHILRQLEQLQQHPVPVLLVGRTHGRTGRLDLLMTQ